jgi:FHA domain/Double zinc ribbon
MTAVCPAGHASTAEDYCDVCGAPIQAAGSSAGSGGVSSSQGSTPTVTGAQICPNCSTENVAEALFCEECGYDFTTGTLPRPASPAPAGSMPAAPAVENQVVPLSPPEGLAGPAQQQVAAEDSAPAAAAATGVGAPGSGSAAAPFTFVAEVWIDPAWYEAQQSPDPLPSPGLPEIVPLGATSVLVGRPSKSRNIHPDVDCEPDNGVSRRQCQLTTDGTRWWVEDLDSANGTFVGPATGPLPDNPVTVGVKQELKPGDRVYVGAWTRIVVRRATEDELTSL